jgi:hypothetical protein
MESRITVHHGDPDDGTTLAVIHADGHISGTDDPQLVVTVREAVREALGQQPPDSAADAGAVADALARRGLRGVPAGWGELPGPASPTADGALDAATG